MNLEQLLSLIPDPLKPFVPKLSEESQGTIMMRTFALTKVPLLFLASPRVIQLDEDGCQIVIPFKKLVKNHVGSLYFGALAIGADACVGMAAMDEIKKSGEKINLIFKDFHAEFLKRAEGDTLFVCSEKEEIRALIQEAIESKERVHRTINCEALVNDEVCAEFKLTLSLKLKS